MNVLVTGAGGAAGVCVIKDLRARHRVVATDVDPLAAGLYLADRAYLTRPADDPGMVAELVRIGRKERVNVLLPTVQEELIAVARARRTFERAGIVPVVSGEEALRIASDKLRTYSFFRSKEFCPKVYDPARPQYPAVVKPLRTRGGRGFRICNNRDEVRLALASNRRSFGESVVMEYVAGTEYSVYGISDREGKPTVAVPVRRVQAVGESKKAEVVGDPRVQEVANEVASALKLVGPWNVQLMRSKDRLVLIEVNPRFAGTTSLVVAAGVDLPELAIKLALGRRISPRELEFRDGLFMTRYNEEIFLTPGQVVARRHRARPGRPERPGPSARR